MAENKNVRKRKDLITTISSIKIKDKIPDLVPENNKEQQRSAL
jgi:hypothetical protein